MLCIYVVILKKLFLTWMECDAFSPSPSLPWRIWRKAGQWKTTCRTMRATFVKVRLWRWNCNNKVVKHGAFSLSRFQVKFEEYACEWVARFVLFTWIYQSYFVNVIFLDISYLDTNLWSVKNTSVSQTSKGGAWVHHCWLSQNVSMSDVVYPQTLT